VSTGDTQNLPTNHMRMLKALYLLCITVYKYY
jgi:hypothetical protein